jgi:hypothetical protein
VTGKTKINLMQRVIIATTTMVVALFPSVTFAEVVHFTCSWDGQKPIKIVVDTGKKTAVRSDGGMTSTVIKANEWNVWLLINDEPGNIVSAKIQVIERAASRDDPSRGGAWTDVIVGSQSVSPIIAGGICWEGIP